MQTRLLPLVLILAAAPMAAQPRLPFDAPARSILHAGVADVPLSKAGAFYFIDVKMNGRPFRFTLETGANFFGISPRAAKALGLKADTIEVMPGQRSAVAAVDSLTMDGVSFHGLTARVTPLFDATDFDGIISVSVLRDLLVTIDLASSRLRLERGSLSAPNGRDIVPIAGRDRGGRVDVLIDLGGLEVPAVLDSRSFLPIIIPDSLESSLRLGDAPRPAGSALGPMLGSFTLRGAHLAGDLRVGEFTFQRPGILLRDRPGAVLGVTFMEQFAITLDQRSRRVRFARAGRGSIASLPSQDWENGGADNARNAGGPTPRLAGPTPTSRPMGFNMASIGGTDLVVKNLVSGSHAEKAGIRNEDRVVEFDGTPAAAMNPDIFRRAIAKGAPVKVMVLRDGKSIEFNIQPQSP